MVEVQEVGAWLESLHGLVTVQQLKNGSWFFSIAREKKSVSAIRPTFADAALTAIQQLHIL